MEPTNEKQMEEQRINQVEKTAKEDLKNEKLRAKLAVKQASIMKEIASLNKKLNKVTNELEEIDAIIAARKQQ